MEPSLPADEGALHLKPAGESRGSAEWSAAPEAEAAEREPALAEAVRGEVAPESAPTSQVEEYAAGAVQASGTSAEAHRVMEPEEIICPITQEMYRDPVFVPDSGNTYEREAIAKSWAASRQCRDPLTNSVLGSSALHTNWGTRREVQRFLDAHPEYVPQGWASREVPAPLRGVGNHSCLPGRLRTVILVTLITVGSAVLLTSWNSTFATRKQEQNSKKFSAAEFPGLPKGSRLAVTNPDNSSLEVLVPPSGNLTAQLLERLFSAAALLGGTAVWTALALRGGRPMPMASWVLWGGLVMLLLRIGDSMFSAERLHLGQAGSVLAIEREVLAIERQVFGWPYARAQILTKDLRGIPQITCESTRACSLNFQVGIKEHTFGSISSLTPDEAAWLQGVLKKQLSGSLSAAGTGWRKCLFAGLLPLLDCGS